MATYIGGFDKPRLVAFVSKAAASVDCSAARKVPSASKHTSKHQADGHIGRAECKGDRKLGQKPGYIEQGDRKANL